MMNFEAIERRWSRLNDAMIDAARTLALPLTGMPVGVALGMIARPETYSPAEMRITAIIFLAILVTSMTAFTVRYWREPEMSRRRRVLDDAKATLEKAQEVYESAMALSEGAAAIHQSTVRLLRTPPASPADDTERTAP